MEERESDVEGRVQGMWDVCIRLALHIGGSGCEGSDFPVKFRIMPCRVTTEGLKEFTKDHVACRI